MTKKQIGVVHYVETLVRQLLVHLSYINKTFSTRQAHLKIFRYCKCNNLSTLALRGVAAPCYQHGLDNKVPQLHATQSEPVDYNLSNAPP